MSNYNITNNTNSRTNTLANTLAPGAVSVTGYNQGGASITSTSLVNSTIESTTTGYKSSGTDIGSIYSAIYNGSAGPATGIVPVANYSSCTLVMCGGGGGAGGSKANPSLNPQFGGTGGAGGISIYEKIPLVGVSNISYSVGTGGAGGAGEFVPALPGRQPAQAGGVGNATIVTISPTTTYTANGGSGGQGAQVQPAGAGTPGNITPTTQTYTSASLNGPLTYQTTPYALINISSVNYAQGGVPGTNKTPIQGQSGGAGRPGYVRVYLYP